MYFQNQRASGECGGGGQLPTWATHVQWLHQGTFAIQLGHWFLLVMHSLDASREFLGQVLEEEAGERGGGYLHVAPWALAVLDAPEVHSVQGGPGALVGLGYRPGPVHPEDHANKCQRDPGAVERFPPQCRAPGEGPAWALVGRKWWRDGDEAAVVPTCRDWWRQGDGQDTRPPRGGSSREDLLPEQLAPG